MAQSTSKVRTVLTITKEVKLEAETSKQIRIQTRHIYIAFEPFSKG